MVSTGLTYLQRGQRGIFVEVYFPKRVTAQGTIFTALEKGYDERFVKKYLTRNLDNLLKELKDFPQVFHSQWYDGGTKRKKVSVIEAKKRIDEYVSPFFGWSNYALDGVFFGEGSKMFEEATQIIRLMFKHESTFIQPASEAGCQDVLRAMLFWIITKQDRLDDTASWGKSEQAKFFREHSPMSRQKRAFVEKYFEPVGRETFKWLGDCFLFIFGYLVRQFSERLKALGHPEEEIWVASFFNLTVSVLKKVEF